MSNRSKKLKLVEKVSWIVYLGQSWIMTKNIEYQLWIKLWIFQTLEKIKNRKFFRVDYSPSPSKSPLWFTAFLSMSVTWSIFVAEEKSGMRPPSSVTPLPFKNILSLESSRDNSSGVSTLTWILPLFCASMLSGHCDEKNI